MLINKMMCGPGKLGMGGGGSAVSLFPGGFSPGGPAGPAGIAASRVPVSHCGSICAEEAERGLRQHQRPGTGTTAGARWSEALSGSTPWLTEGAGHVGARSPWPRRASGRDAWKRADSQASAEKSPPGAGPREHRDGWGHRMGESGHPACGSHFFFFFQDLNIGD